MSAAISDPGHCKFLLSQNPHSADPTVKAHKALGSLDLSTAYYDEWPGLAKRASLSQLPLLNSKSPHASFLAMLDSGATSGFAPTRWQKYMIRVVNLKTPVKVKLGTSASYARSKGLIPNCIASAADKQEPLGISTRFYIRELSPGALL